MTTQHTMPDARWTLLFMGKHGRTITLKRFKGIVLSFLLVLGIFIAIAAGLFFWNRNLVEERNQLESSLKKLEERNAVLRHERDVFLTRLVVAESRQQENRAGLSEEQDGEKQLDQPVQDIPAIEQSSPPDRTTAEIEAQDQVQPEQDSDQPDSGLSVTIENFKISARPDSDSLTVRFKIKNTSLYSQYVSGHAIVVLKGEEIQKDQWVSIPGVPLVDGRPTGNRQGKAFGISNYKTMRFAANALQSFEKFQTATAYVFTHTGELLLEQNFDFELTAGSR